MLGLAEIENRTPSSSHLGVTTRSCNQDLPSGRGIECGLIYDAKVFKLAGSKFHHVEAETTRDIVEAELKSGTDSLFVFVNHWPARSNPESFRVTAGKTLRARIDQILATNAAADIVAIGDVNDNPADEASRRPWGRSPSPVIPLAASPRTAACTQSGQRPQRSGSDPWIEGLESAGV